MKGDFSSWRKESGRNFNGVLHQQGKVLLDSDWNAQTRITKDWQDTAGQDVIGSGIAAVPADGPGSFLVKSARIVSTLAGPQVELTLGAGRLWADGWLVHLAGEKNEEEVIRIAAYFDGSIPILPPLLLASPPIMPPRDAVILELWREEINGFQLPELLIEPALGGPDTTERVHTAMAFKLLRLTDGETCDSILPKLREDFSEKGRLTVSLQPTLPGEGDCPVVTGGGYTGFEHNLYRIEVAKTKIGLTPMFKWSQFNGGLVGRGEFDPIDKVLHITANAPAIQTTGLNRFYLEALQYDPAPEGNLGHWRLIYGAKVTLDEDGFFHLPVPGSADELFGAIPAMTMTGSPPHADDTVFFRLWNDIRVIDDFTTESLLQDGIFLRFDASAGYDYTAGDYWTFPVRAGEIANEEILIDQRPPEGIHYRRVPLAILQWNVAEISFDLGDIQDCRRTFHPLTRLSTCCTYRVGDGMHSHGDFTKIQQAIEHLPAEGGEICVLPGIYTEDIRLSGRRNIILRGCGPRSRIRATGVVSPDTGGDAQPAIFVLECQNICIESLVVEAHETGPGILLEGPPAEASDVGDDRVLRHITIRDVEIAAQTHSAIRTHVGYFVTIQDCRIAVTDQQTSWAAIYFVGEDALIENNEIQVVSGEQARTFSAVVGSPVFVFAAQHARGGLHIGGGSERVRILNNLIQGGTGHGISLGSVDQDRGNNLFWILFKPWQLIFLPLFDICRPWPVLIPGGVVVLGGGKPIAGAPLSEIHIEGNRIHGMGSNGIGVDAFFDLSEADEFISVKGLAILRNEIRRCLNHPAEPIPENMVDSMGYGGIALADVEDLVIRDNVIEDNGFDYQEPICGLFILHAEGVEISRNRIINNGARTGQPKRQFKLGRRGGIHIVYGVAPQSQMSQPFLKVQIPYADGVPAVKIHDNIVSTPLGQALSLGALGPVSVIGNQFTTLGSLPGMNSPTFAAATVLIFNMGLSNELWFQLLTFSALRNGQIRSSPKAVKTPDTEGNISLEGLDDFRLGQYLANGNVLFTNNQCRLNLMESGSSMAMTSVLIISLDDVGFHNNQCDCELFDDFILTQVSLYGTSLRVSDNRFKESLPTMSYYKNNSAMVSRPTMSVLFSAITHGYLNITTDNESTRCLLIRGGLVLNRHNLVLLDLLAGRTGNIEDIQSICDYGNQLLPNFGSPTHGFGLI